MSSSKSGLLKLAVYVDLPHLVSTFILGRQEIRIFLLLRNYLVRMYAEMAFAKSPAAAMAQLTTPSIQKEKKSSCKRRKKGNVFSHFCV